jgi:hypothetical protein
MDVLGFSPAFGAVADIAPAGLEVLAVGARRDLVVGALSGKPDLKVDGFRRLKSQI